MVVWERNLHQSPTNLVAIQFLAETVEFECFKHILGGYLKPRSMLLLKPEFQFDEGGCDT